jgi:hypothetical protein
MATTLLERLTLSEVSGVDHPASGLEGFVVMKRRERAEARTAMAAAIRKTYGLNRDALGRFASGSDPAPAEEEAPRSLWRHHGAVVEALRGRSQSRAT